MKAYIGKYPRRLQSNMSLAWYRWVTNDCVVNDSDISRINKMIESILDVVDDALQAVFNVCYNKPFIDNRDRTIRIKIHDDDLFNLDHTISILVVELLSAFIENGQTGSPSIDADDVPDGMANSLLHDKWNYVLNEMLWAFEQHKIQTWEDQYCSGEVDLVREKIEGTDYCEIKKGPNDTFKVDHEGVQKHHERIENGLRLFAKYFGGLWD